MYLHGGYYIPLSIFFQCPFLGNRFGYGDFGQINVTYAPSFVKYYRPSIFDILLKNIENC